MTFDLYQEFRRVVAALHAANIPYALCGGLAVSIYAEPRATIDVDLLILVEDYERAAAAVRLLGFAPEAKALPLAAGKVMIRRLVKIEETVASPATERDVLVLDLLLAAAPEQKEIFAERVEREWDGFPLWLVSREGLIALKRLRGSDQDRVDIARLTAGGR